uniref:Uncharacterized protein n=1 Tax=Rhizophora mucronata TaxID=61149 RepID=A0A2P2NED4_RHIMU
MHICIIFVDFKGFVSATLMTK